MVFLVRTDLKLKQTEIIEKVADIAMGKYSFLFNLKQTYIKK